MVGQSYLVLGFDGVDFVVEHLLVGVEPESEGEAAHGGEGHDFYVLDCQFLTVFWGEAIEVGEG